MKKKRFDFEYLKGKAIDRKGMGMELALLVLLVVFACSVLLVSSALTGSDYLLEKKEDFVQQMTVDQLAEDYLQNGTVTDADRFADYAVFLHNGTEWKKQFGSIEIAPVVDAADAANGRVLITDLSGNPLLIIEKTADGRILRWDYR